ncbi:hypothetical protein OH76DRAFT_358768 [Lentinus brumalis]|uniref:Uncharacterized protein n=1 Tax=Lentinus brumalis TaxID=2498619 RepID=A0A371CJG0_9APHY|nr:hypothetical protein OH76DRAFT_358768 [Polyporus brumalis]
MRPWHVEANSLPTALGRSIPRLNMYNYHGTRAESQSGLSPSSTVVGRRVYSSVQCHSESELRPSRPVSSASSYVPSSLPRLALNRANAGPTGPDATRTIDSMRSRLRATSTTSSASSVTAEDGTCYPPGRANFALRDRSAISMLGLPLSCQLARHRLPHPGLTLALSILQTLPLSKYRTSKLGGDPGGSQVRLRDV